MSDSRATYRSVSHMAVVRAGRTQIWERYWDDGRMDGGV